MAEKVRDYKKLAQTIVDIIGADNIVSAGHCATRLRLVLKETPADAKEKRSVLYQASLQSLKMADNSRS